VAYSCRKCGCEVNATDAICPSCKADLKEVGRNIELIMTETLSIGDSVGAQLTKAEEQTLKRLWTWLKAHWPLELSAIAVTFPSGYTVTFIFKKRDSGTKT